MVELHRLQTRVLRELSQHPTRRFSDMMRVTGLTSDDFKFHLRKLIKLGLVEKDEIGAYRLTATGKELANRFDDDRHQPIRQPKLTTVVYLRKEAPDGNARYLFQQRLRQPFYGYWGVIGEPIHWGDDILEAAARGLTEQTGLIAKSLSIKGFYRQRDVAEDTKKLLEDKLFVIILAQWHNGEPSGYQFAQNKWMTPDEAKKQPAIFESCLDMLDMLEDKTLHFADNTTSYLPTLY